MQPTLANRNNNPGNIKDPATGQFRQFATPQEGYAALMNDLEIKKSGKSVTGLRPESTLADFAKAYAPASDRNDPAQYTANLANHMGVRPDAQLRDLDTGKWAEAIANAEGYKGQQSPRPQANSSLDIETEAPMETSINEKPKTALGAGLEALGNIPGSAVNFGKNVVHSLNPVNNIKTLGKVPGAFKETVEATGGILPALFQTIKGIPKAAYQTLVPQGLQQAISGDFAGAAETFKEDPFGQVAPVVLGLKGGAELADRAATKSAMAEYVKEPFTKQAIPKPTTKYGDAFNTGVQKTAGIVTIPIGAVARKVGNAAGGVSRSLASQLTGLDPQTMQQIISNPNEFSKVARDNTSRGGLAGEVFKALEDRIEGLEETGKGYDPIRKQTELIPETTGFIEDILGKNGLRIEKGRIKADSTSSTRNASDLNAMQEFYDNWGGRVGLTPSEFLNMRSDLANLAKYDKITGTGKTAKSQIISDQLRQSANNIFRKHVKGMDKLDARYSEEAQFLKQVKKDYLNSDGTFKDGAINKIANAAGVGKANLLGRLEEILPGVTKRIQILKAVEDIERANGIKVGTYAKGAIQGGAILSGNIPGAIISSILMSPGSAVRILRAAGYTGSKATPILEALKTIGGNVNKVKSSRIGILPTLMAQREKVR